MAASVKGSLPVSPRDDWFDRLARNAARNGSAGRREKRESISRRDAVGVFAGTTVMAMVGSWLRPTPALSAGAVQGKDPGCSGIRTFYRAGCPKPVPKRPPYTPAKNGCGPQNGFNPVPQAPLYLASFTPACDAHDVGYGTCNRPKDVTDTKFLEDMKAICAGPGTPVGIVMSILLYQCIRNAEIFYTAVSELGDDPYKDGQSEGCDCCDDCPNGAPKCKGECCKGPNWVCGSSGLCCEDCAPTWHKCAHPAQKRCGFGCCRPADGLCCPGIQPGDLRCCNANHPCFKGGCG